jgi:hypothetical protein
MRCSDWNNPAETLAAQLPPAPFKSQCSFLTKLSAKSHPLLGNLIHYPLVFGWNYAGKPYAEQLGRAFFGLCPQNVLYLSCLAFAFSIAEATARKRRK